MAWFALIVAGIFEMIGVACINQFNKQKSFGSLSRLVGSFGLSFYLLAYAMDSLAMGTAYAIWTGIGASGGALLGMFLYGEDKNWQRVFCLFMILGAAVGLKLIG